MRLILHIIRYAKKQEFLGQERSCPYDNFTLEVDQNWKQILPAACGRFAMVRISNNGPG